MLGLMSSEQFKTQRSLNSRRQVTYEFPNGTGTLVALLSLMPTEFVDKPEIGWFEKRMTANRTTTAAYNAAGPYATTAGVDLTSGGWSQAIDTTIRIKVADTSPFRASSVIWVKDSTAASGVLTRDIYALVTAIIDSTTLEVRLLEAVAAGMYNTSANVGLSVVAIGTANQEGGYSGKGQWTAPYNPKNYTQIFRTAFGFTRTALKIGTVFDKTGIYKDAAKENALRHMNDLEFAFLFGQKNETTTTNADGDTVPIRTMGGIMYFLRQWELGTPYGVEAASSDTHVNKRIIKQGGDATPITRARLNTIWKNLFRTTSTKSWEKLGLCGNGYLAVLNELFEGTTLIQSGIKSDDTYGMVITRVTTPFGDIVFKTHPLFNLYPELNYSCMYLDVGNLKYHPLQDSDTTLLKNRQLPDADRRKDEWLTEATLECQLPDSHLWHDNMTRWEP
jgi:hypothetical protein